MDNKISTPRKTTYTIAAAAKQKTVDPETKKITYSIFDLTNYTAVLGVKERKDSKTYKIFVTGTIDDPTTGVITFDLTDTDTDLQPKVYVYGILIENSITGDRQELEIENPFFEIEPSIMYEPEPS